MKVALDVDDVLAAFTPHAHDYFNVPLQVCDYWCVPTMDSILGQGWFLDKIAHDPEFWKTLPTLSKPDDIDFDFNCYISAFPEAMYDLRVKWLEDHGFPRRELIVSNNKLDTCLKLGVTHLVDDKPSTIETVNKHGIKGIHFMTEYAGFKPVGNRIITNLNQVKIYL